MLKIETLCQDIYSLFGSGVVPKQADLDDLGKAMSLHIADAFKKRDDKGKLRGSKIGTSCDRKLYYSVLFPEEAELPSPWALNKFLYGHLLEEQLLFYVPEAGHTLEHRQLEVELDGVKGHIDGVVDGLLVDVKSANSRGMSKFYNNGLKNDDPFGYLKQLLFYHAAMLEAGYDIDKKRFAFLVIDKELGHIILDIYDVPENNINNMKAIVARQKAIVADKETVPPRGFFSVPDGKSGNMQLDLQCRYCPHKKKCWPGLRTFLYANGPRFLTLVKKEPDVPEAPKEDRR